MSRNEIQDHEREEIARFVEVHWHSRIVMSRGRSFYPHQEQGLSERSEGKIVGLLTFRIENNEMEILTLNSTLEGHGIGSSLMVQAIDVARHRGCHRVFLTTTNDNLKGIGFYQLLGFRMVQINLGAVDEARRIKPQIPQFGERGVPIHDEIVMEIQLEPYIGSP